MGPDKTSLPGAFDIRTETPESQLNSALEIHARVMGRVGRMLETSRASADLLT